ncbi:MAG: LysE family translocator [Candidatus Binataceae bacterium]
MRGAGNELEIWALFAATEGILCLTPGPAVLLVLAQGLSRGRTAALWAALGSLAANSRYFILSATSLGAILVASFDLFLMVKWIDAVYLVYLGLRTFFGKSSALSMSIEERRPIAARRMLANGFVLQASNPKTLIFFTAILPQFVNPHAHLAYQIAILGVTSVVIEFFVLLGYGSFAGQVSLYALRPRFAKLTDRIAGSMLVAAGIGIAAIRREA